MSFAKTITCTAVAAATLGVTIGLIASSASTDLYVAPNVAAQAITQSVTVPQAVSYVQKIDADNTALNAQNNDFAEGQYNAATTWATAGLLSAGAAIGAFVLAVRNRASNSYEALRDDPEAVLGNAGRVIGAAVVSAAVASSASAASLTFDEIKSLSYNEVKGSGLANTCPIIADGTGNKLSLKAGNYKMEGFCLEPSSFKVKSPPDALNPVPVFENTTLMTRLTYTLDGISADLQVGGDGSWSLKEKDGIDYAATTVQLAKGERVPFLFTVKNLEAKGDAGQFLGQFDVPSYRGATFLDPKGRGAATGYDTAVALPASGDDEEYSKENAKSTAASVGTIAFKVAKVNAETGEVAGVFESIQPSDTDLGAKAPKDIKASGVWYAQISPA